MLRRVTQELRAACGGGAAAAKFPRGGGQPAARVQTSCHIETRGERHRRPRRAAACRRARPHNAGRRGQGSNAARKRGSDVSAVREKYEAVARIMSTFVAVSPFPCAFHGFQVVPSKAKRERQEPTCAME